MWDDDQFGSLEVYMLCVMMMSLEVWRFTLGVCGDWEFRSVVVWKFRYSIIKTNMCEVLLSSK